MIKCEVIEQFTLGRFDEIKDTIKRKNADTYGKLNVGDIFECSKDLAEYLTGKNNKQKVVVRIIEVLPVKKTSKK